MLACTTYSWLKIFSFLTRFHPFTSIVLSEDNMGVNNLRFYLIGYISPRPLVTYCLRNKLNSWNGMTWSDFSHNRNTILMVFRQYDLFRHFNCAGAQPFTETGLLCYNKSSDQWFPDNWRSLVPVKNLLSVLFTSDLPRLFQTLILFWSWVCLWELNNVNSQVLNWEDFFFNLFGSK